MSTGKYLSLEETRNEKKQDRFDKDNPSAGDRVKFGRLLDVMAEHGSSRLPCARDEVVVKTGCIVGKA